MGHTQSNLVMPVTEDEAASPAAKERPRYIIPEPDNTPAEDLNVDIKVPNFLVRKEFNKQRWIYSDEDTATHGCPTIQYWNNKAFSTL